VAAVVAAVAADHLGAMSERYEVRGGVGASLPGVVRPAEVDATVEWVPVRRDGALLDLLAARLGSEADVHKIVLGVLAPLVPVLDGPSLGALVAHLPLSTAGELAAGGAAVGARIRAPTGAGDYLLEVARLILHPPPRAATYVRAVFAAARRVLSPAESEAIARRLPHDLAELWSTAR
jgi:uncharacterized protein (DUF2267 family)